MTVNNTDREQLVGMLETLSRTGGVSKSEFEDLIGYLTNEVVAWMHDEQQLISRDLLSDVLEVLTTASKEGQIRKLVIAALKVHEGLDDASVALESLYPDRPSMKQIQEPYTDNDDFTLIMEASCWVDFETTFRDQKEDETVVEWLRAYLSVDTIVAAAIAVVKKKGSISDLRRALREGKVI